MLLHEVTSFNHFHILLFNPPKLPLQTPQGVFGAKKLQDAIEKSNHCSRKVPIGKVQRRDTQGERISRSPVVSSSHALLIDGPVQLLGVGEDGLVVDDDGLDNLVDVRLAGDLVLAVGRWHERRAEAYGQVVRVHHVLVAVLGQAEEEDSEVRIRKVACSWKGNDTKLLREALTHWLRKAKR